MDTLSKDFKNYSKKNLRKESFIHSKEMLHKRFGKQPAVITKNLSDLIPRQIIL